MKAVAAVGRYWIIVIFSLTVQLGGPVVGPVLAWSQYWRNNASTILLFTAVNTTITTVSEASTRVIWPMLTSQEEHGFIVTAENGHSRINQQSLISIFMTFIASMLGGPVYFIRRRSHRFIFFLSFGLFNSMVSQSLVSFFRDGLVLLAAQRLFFDFFYNGTLKFFLFETSRPAILKRRSSFCGVAVIRVIQDFLTTLFRVAILSGLGLKG